MGKAASKDQQSNTPKQKRGAVLDDTETDDYTTLENKGLRRSPSMLSPERFGPVDTNNATRTPKTSRCEEYECEPTLESLPIDLLVKILCHLHHDQLRAVFHVSQIIRKAVVIARQFHFNYTTPDQSPKVMSRETTPLPTKHWPFVGRIDGNGIRIPSPHTTNAPRQGPKSRLKCTEKRRITAFLFPESEFPTSSIVTSSLQNHIRKFLASNRSRALFDKSELCQAVDQNKLR